MAMHSHIHFNYNVHDECPHHPVLVDYLLYYVFTPTKVCLRTCKVEVDVVGPARVNGSG